MLDKFRLIRMFLCLVLLFLVYPAVAAVYSHGQSNKSNITDLYRQIVVNECGDSLYTAQQFGGGYIGLAGSASVSDHFVNFSIWDNGQGDLNFVVEGPDPRLGGTVERFGNEGTGAKTTTKLRWDFGFLYKTYVKVEHINGGSLLSGWINRANSQDWYICGRIFIPNSTYYLGNGLMFLETLSDHEGLLGIRQNGATLGWVRNNSGWEAMTGLEWSCQSQHIERASGYNTSTIHYLTFEANNQAPWYPDTWYQVPPGMSPTPSSSPATMDAYNGPIEDISFCSTTDAISKSAWSLLYVDSEETSAEDGAATNAFDDNTSTYWHTQWSGGSPAHPHEIQIDLGDYYDISGFSCLPRQDSQNGAIADFEFYVSEDGASWGNAVATGTWGLISGICNSETFPSKYGRYVSLVALSEINGNPWTTAAEINVYGVSGSDGTANADIAVAGTVSGSYANTTTSNDVYESITEVQSGGKPANRYSYLEHKWTINVTGGDTVTFYVEAYQSPSSDGDNFVFAYSTNDSTYTDMVTVTKTSDNDNTQSYALLSSTSGTVYIRVKDTDRTSGNLNMDTIYIDYMYIESSGGGGCTPTDMHIEAVACAETSCGGGKKNGKATVTIYDDCGNPVANALVDGTFTGDFSETFYDVQTDQYGDAVFTTAGCIRRPAFTFTVDDVTDSLPHDPGDDLATGCSG
jgi:hypothetical protein